VSDVRSRLVIVESPAKARTIGKFLGPGWQVEASVGHVRDLIDKAKEAPDPRFKDPVGVDVNAGYEPCYRVEAKDKPRVTELKRKLKDADELVLATDEDREGEAIAWHLLQLLKPTVPVRRMVFHEITKEAIARAVEQTRDLDEDLVEAQETRRIVDRLYGYPLSEVLWRRVRPNLSAGRVVSVATKLLVDRERERMAFRSATYCDLTATLDTARPDDDPRTCSARLVGVDGRRVATGRDFDDTGALRSAAVTDQVVVLDAAAAQTLATALREVGVSVASREPKPYRSRPKEPFRTSTLQQEASRRLGFTAQRTMKAAQSLYQNGYITYMRTDSITLSDTALAAAREQVRALFGDAYVPASPRVYRSKVKNAQEAHEAIRPAGEHFRTPSETGLTGDEFRVYELIWQRTLASQMPDATGEQVSLRFTATLDGNAAGRVLELAASGRVITFPGHLRVYAELGEDTDVDRPLPPVQVGQALDVTAAEPEQHQTRPPARYTEASLVKELEEREIGRPSTYASILESVLRHYARKRGSALVPTWVAFAATRLLEEHFTHLVDYEFTARMEDVLDGIARGEDDRVAALDRFWRGGGDYVGLADLLQRLPEIDAREVNTLVLREPDGQPSDIVVRVGRYGPFVQDADGATGTIPDDVAPDELTPALGRELIAAKAQGNRVLGVHPDSGLPVEVRVGRYGPYVSEVAPQDDAPRKRKPQVRRASLLTGMEPQDVTFDQALQLLSLPRTVGVPADGEPVEASKGPYGPYVRQGKEYRTLPSDESIFTVSLDEALALLAQPKAGRGRTASPGTEVGVDPATGSMITLKDGRYGPYVTDGTTNASLPRGESPDALTLERAAELLAARREAGPAKRPARKAPARKAPARKAPAKGASSSKASRPR
jgi:DNA topoisomerase-1